MNVNEFSLEYRYYDAYPISKVMLIVHLIHQGLKKRKEPINAICFVNEL